MLRIDDNGLYQYRNCFQNNYNDVFFLTSMRKRNLSCCGAEIDGNSSRNNCEIHCLMYLYYYLTSLITIPIDIILFPFFFICNNIIKFVSCIQKYHREKRIKKEQNKKQNKKQNKEQNDSHCIKMYNEVQSLVKNQIPVNPPPMYNT
jgi:hypothetical protein